MHAGIELAVVLPAYNEALAIAKVISDFRRVFPEAFVVVVDNRSSDGTAAVAREALSGGAGLVLEESTPGKAQAVRRAFLEIDARIYVLCDADDTYPVEEIPPLIEAVRIGRCDMAVGDRHTSRQYAAAEKRPFHNWGNKLIAKLVNRTFDGELSDVLSGLRVFSRRFVRNYPILARGFALEVDMASYALDRRFRTLEFPISYRSRPQGSTSKLKTVPDGVRVLMALFNLARFYRPLGFFGSIALVFMLFGITAGFPVVADFLRTGLVPRLPLAVLATGLELCAVISLSIGLVLDGLVHHQQLQTERDLLKDGSS